MNPCSICSAKCCKKYDVFINHEDISKIYDITNNFSFVKKIEYHKSYGDVPSFILWENNKKKKWVLCLSNPDSICIFLKNDRCSIYRNRPSICKTYPFYEEDGEIKESNNVCPTKWKLLELNLKKVKSDYQEMLVNFLTFETICVEWNKIVDKNQKLENFLIFVKNYLRIDDN